MKASIIATAAALFTSAIAAPTNVARQTTAASWFHFSLANDFTGANAASAVAINQGPVHLSALFAGSNLIKNGRVIATSAQNINPVGDATLCIFKDPATGNVFRLNDQVTFADLDGNKDKAVETDVSNFTFECEL